MPPVDLDALVSQSKERRVWLRVGQLVDGVSDRPSRDANLVFDAREIHFVGTSSPPREVLPEGRREPDAVMLDVTALPCLIEAHAHLFLAGAPANFKEREAYLETHPDQLLVHARNRWSKILQTGVGAVRDAGDKHRVGLTLAREAKQQVGQLATTPYIDSPGAAIHHRGRYGAFMGQPIEDHTSLAACVASRVHDGADRIKLLVSGIINFKEGRVTAPPQMPVDEVRAIVESAHAHGRQTFAHASGTDGVENSVEGGVDTVEHGFFITEDQLKRMRDRRIGWVPTFAPVQAQIDRAADLGWDDVVVGHLKRIIDGHREMLRRAHEMGVLIIAGSDAGSCGVPHGVGFIDELVHMETAGMPPIAIVNSATGVGAERLSFPEKIGRLAPGFRSRLILTRRDPLKTVANLHREKTILFDGAVVPCPDRLDPTGL